MNSTRFYTQLREQYGIESESTVIKLPFKNIISVNADTLVYKDKGGAISHISLSDCFRNFSVRCGEDTRGNVGRPLLAVGGRYFSKPVAFYEFYTMGHHVRFYMTLKSNFFKRFVEKIGFNADAKAFSEFYSLQKKLNGFGYSAVDLR